MSMDGEGKGGEGKGRKGQEWRRDNFGLFTVLIVEMFSQLYAYFTAKQIINFNYGHFISIICNMSVL